MLVFLLPGPATLLKWQWCHACNRHPDFLRCPHCSVPNVPAAGVYFKPSARGHAMVRAPGAGECIGPRLLWGWGESKLFSPEWTLIRDFHAHQVLEAPTVVKCIFIDTILPLATARAARCSWDLLFLPCRRRRSQAGGRGSGLLRIHLCVL